MTYHKQMSQIKSWLRIIGYVFLLINFLEGVLILIASEIFGLLEERKEK